MYLTSGLRCGWFAKDISSECDHVVAGPLNKIIFKLMSH